MTLQNRQGTPIDKLYRAKQRAPLFALGVNLLHNQQRGVTTLTNAV